MSGQNRAARASIVLVAAAAVAISALAGGSDARAAAESPAAPTAARRIAPASPGLEKIKHIVIIMQENRTFDGYFGTFPGADGLPRDAAGNIDVCIPNPLDASGECARPFHDTRDRNVGGPHAYEDSVVDVNGGKMDGFVKVFKSARERCLKKFLPGCGGADAKHPDVMGYRDESDIPNYWRYARDFVLQDHMFAQVNSWSLPAHLFMVSAWSARCKNDDPFSCVNDVIRPPDARRPQGLDDVIYAWTDITHLLHANDVPWAYYVFKGNEPDCRDESTITCRPEPQEAATPGIWNPLPLFTTVKDDGQLDDIKSVNEFDRAARTGKLPSVSWVIPNSVVSEHPMSKVSAGQAYVTGLVNELMCGPDWDSTAILFSYDDWGGFYDHVVPPDVDQNGYGIRVPGMVISPYAKHGMIDSQILSHDAYLKLIEDAFLGGQRLDPLTDGRPDPRPTVREDVPILGDITASFDFSQAPREGYTLDPNPGKGPAVAQACPTGKKS
jgi:phospholipase C